MLGIHDLSNVGDGTTAWAGCLQVDEQAEENTDGGHARGGRRRRLMAADSINGANEATVARKRGEARHHATA